MRLKRLKICANLFNQWQKTICAISGKKIATDYKIKKIKNLCESFQSVAKINSWKFVQLAAKNSHRL